MKKAVDDRTDRFRGARQHDAHGFLGVLLEVLEDELKEVDVPDNLIPSSDNLGRSSRVYFDL